MDIYLEKYWYVHRRERIVIRFGIAGNPNSFYEQGFKSSLEIPQWLNKLGLNAYEYQCTYGVKLKEETAKKIGEAAQKYNISLSIHGPYYINCAQVDLEKREKTKEHLINSLKAAKWMGARKVVFHPGSASGVKREVALQRAKELLLEVIEQANEKGFGEIKLAPETMGKVSQLGDLLEIIDLCKISSNIIPTIDFAHLHALNGGNLTRKDEFAKILDELAQELAFNLIEDLHIHFSPIEYTKAGEKRHRTLLDEGFGPIFEPLAELIDERSLSPTIICESNGRQAEDALVYKEIYWDIKNK